MSSTNAGMFLLILASTSGVTAFVVKLRTLISLDRQFDDARSAATPEQVEEIDLDGLPEYGLITFCPKDDCQVRRAHLVLMLTDRSASRQCVECGHEWKEKIG